MILHAVSTLAIPHLDIAEGTPHAVLVGDAFTAYESAREALAAFDASEGEG